MPESGSAAVGGGDPSDRFATLLDCGCEQAQGTWFYCPEHQPRPPAVAVLDLAAVECDLHQTWPRTARDYTVVHDHVRALLAHCRALRAALTVLVNTTPVTAMHSRAAAVLAQATDAEAP